MSFSPVDLWEGAFLHNEDQQLSQRAMRLDLPGGFRLESCVHEWHLLSLL